MTKVIMSIRNHYFQAKQLTVCQTFSITFFTITFTIRELLTFMRFFIIIPCNFLTSTNKVHLVFSTALHLLECGYQP